MLTIEMANHLECFSLHLRETSTHLSGYGDSVALCDVHCLIPNFVSLTSLAPCAMKHKLIMFAQPIDDELCIFIHFISCCAPFTRCVCVNYSTGAFAIITTVIRERVWKLLLLLLCWKRSLVLIRIPVYSFENVIKKVLCDFYALIILIRFVVPHDS